MRNVDRSADRSTQSSEPVDGFPEPVSIVEEIIGIQILVAVVPIKVAVKLSRPRLTQDLNGRTHVAAILRGVVVGNDFDLVDRLHTDRGHGKSLPVGIARPQSIHHGVVPIQPRTGYSWSEAAHVSSQRLARRKRIAGGAFGPLPHGNSIDA